MMRVHVSFVLSLNIHNVPDLPFLSLYSSRRGIFFRGRIFILSSSQSGAFAKKDDCGWKAGRRQSASQYSRMKSTCIETLMTRRYDWWNKFILLSTPCPILFFFSLLPPLITFSPPQSDDVFYFRFSLESSPKDTHNRWKAGCSSWISRGWWWWEMSLSCIVKGSRTALQKAPHQSSMSIDSEEKRNCVESSSHFPRNKIINLIPAPALHLRAS